MLHYHWKCQGFMVCVRKKILYKILPICTLAKILKEIINYHGKGNMHGNHKKEKRKLDLVEVISGRYPDNYI